jgi:GSH-dependent disulfide-bond oxidoreductase
MIELHFVPTPNGHKASIMLEEVGLAYTIRPYNLLEGEHLGPAFRRINPNARLPAIVDHAPADGGGPFAVFETGAILEYLAEKSGGQMIPPDVRGRSLCRQWLAWQVSGFGPMHGQAHHFIRYAPPGQDYAINRYRLEAERLLHVLDRRLAEAEYLAGDHYSIADIATWPWLRATRAIELPFDRFAHITRWFDAIAARPGVIRGTQITNEANLASRRPTLTDEQWSNLFGANMHASARVES